MWMPLPPHPCPAHPPTRQWYTILTRPVPARRQVGTERGVYSYQTPQAVRERMDNPDSRRQQLLDLVMEERRRKKESAAAAAAAGNAAGGSAGGSPAAAAGSSAAGATSGA